MSMKARLIDERGAALPAAVAVLAIICIVGVVLTSSAVQISGKSNRDHDSKRALAAAEGGLQVARYRLNKVLPTAGQCLTDQGAAAAVGECPPVDGTLGGGASFTYYVTPVLTAGARCAGVAIQAGGAVQGLGLTQRCITSTGSANRQKRRVQSLVEATGGTSLFPFDGILGLDKVKINENGFGDIRGKVASNGQFELKSCKTSGSASQVVWDPGPGGTLANSCGGSVQPASPARTEDWTLDGIDDLIANPNTADALNNDNAAVFSNRAGFQYTFDLIGGKRELKDTADASLILDGPNPRAGSGGIYTFNFCKLTLTHKTTMTFRNGAVARFFIDSSERVGSACGTTGSLTITNVSNMNYDPSASPPGDPTLLQFLVYGSASVNITNQSGFAAALYAPNADVKFTNKTTWYGSIAAKSVEATNGLDFHPGNVSAVQRPGGVSSYTRRDWIECRSEPTDSADPESGC